jgi:hypothetical protein
MRRKIRFHRLIAISPPVLSRPKGNVFRALAGKS